jgi:hypothetical protein
VLRNYSIKFSECGSGISYNHEKGSADRAALPVGFLMPGDTVLKAADHRAATCVRLEKIENFLHDLQRALISLSINQVAYSAEGESFHHRFVEEIVWETELDLARFVEGAYLLC